ncbi:unnamed protein product (macronuclear) [Paramecium tetraurelia]|uniref:4'-phosphopantetheinyl transferase domain-containing protein n=1 Tax=Paramecium tetraurelia TaxID=5888 RepID=A0E2F8_PARTE|nr:uncharacterized protein GSPATT00022647001 [Paramecium tetraurelia]CAK89475.1 unnamed protein product [Paramecium tetraurelia]|eukprot:XP_001456872.1 hypothetical protein (macronuclear) [Paramecium tetraurelia strain d4-2]
MKAIKGIGVDIVNNQRMLNIIKAQYAERFLVKVLHPSEIEQFKGKSTIQLQQQFLASRWAVKEALVKASSFKELVFPEVEICRKHDKPNIVLHNTNLEYFKKNFGNDYEIQVSISHEDSYSIGFVILQI